jgi:hypothetical protein
LGTQTLRPARRRAVASYAVAFLLEPLIDRGALKEAEAVLVATGLDGGLPRSFPSNMLLLRRGQLRRACDRRYRNATAPPVSARDSFHGEQQWEGSTTASVWEESSAAVAVAVAKRKPASTISGDQSDRQLSAAASWQTGP